VSLLLLVAAVALLLLAPAPRHVERLALAEAPPQQPAPRPRRLGAADTGILLPFPLRRRRLKHVQRPLRLLCVSVIPARDDEKKGYTAAPKEGLAAL
jgi:hypothetical protein